MAKTTKAASQGIPEDSLFDYPPFPGIERAGFTFLKNLKKNNTREWFNEERKEFYRNHLEEPVRQLLAELRLRFMEEGLPFEPEPRRGIYKIHRDVRFSNDKTPFKTRVGAPIPLRGEGRDGIGNYLHLEPGNCFYGAGIYNLDSTGLRNLRSAIDHEQEELIEIISKLEEEVGDLRGEQLKRAPAGYLEDHPAIDLLRYKQMYAFKEFPQSLAESRDLVDWIVITTKATLPFHRFLYRAIRGVELLDETRLKGVKSRKRAGRL